MRVEWGRLLPQADTGGDIDVGREANGRLESNQFRRQGARSREARNQTAGLAGLVGHVYAETTPSVTGVKIMTDHVTQMIPCVG